VGAVPTYVNQGAFTAGTGALSVPVPTGYADGDILVLLVSSANETISTPGGWTEVTNSPQGTGTAGAAGGIRLAAFWKLVSGSQSAVSVADSGSVTAGQMFLFRGIDSAGPINITAGSVNTPASTSWSCPAVTTTIPNCLILNCIGQDRDANSITSLTAASNANLASLTKRADETVNAGAGGGLGLYTGSKVVAGDTGVTSVTSATTTTAAFITIALAPPTTFGASQSESSAISDIIGGGGGAPIEAARAETAAVSETTVGVIPITAVQAETAAVTEEYLPYKKVTVVSVVNLPSKDNSATENTGRYGSATITVPDGADFCILFHGSREENPPSTPPFFDGFLGSPQTGPNFFALGGQTLALIARSLELDPLEFNNEYIWDVAGFSLAAPPLGEQIFEWRFYPISSDHFFSFVFYANVHQTDPLMYQPANGLYYRDGCTTTGDLTDRNLVIVDEEGGLVVGAVTTMAGATPPTIEGNGQTLRLLQGGTALNEIAMMVGDYVSDTADRFYFDALVYGGYLAFALRRSVGELHRAAQVESIGSISDASLGQDQTQYVHSAIIETLVVAEAGSSNNAESVDLADTSVISVVHDGEAVPSGAEIIETAEINDEEDSFATNEGFDRGVGEGAVCSDSIESTVTIERGATDSLPVHQINGPYVDIPTEIMFSDSRSYQIHDYANTASGGRSVTIHQNTNLLIFCYHTLFYNPAWIQEGNYTLTLNGTPFVHLANTNAAGYNVMVAYFKNPESGNIAWNFPNPNFGGIEAYADIIKICQFTNVDISGDPFRSIISPEGVTNASSLTLSGISYNEGDMLVGIEYGMGGGAYGEVRCDVGRQPNLISGGAYNSSYGWSIRTTVGVVPWGASSIVATTADGATQDYIYMMALVLKVKLEGWIASPATTEAGSLTPSDTLTSTSFYTEEVDRTDSLEATELHNGFSSATEEADRTDSAAITEAQVGTQSYGGSVADSLTIAADQIASRYVYGTGYAWAIVRATQNSHKTVASSVSDTLISSEEIIAWRGLYVSLADTATVEEITSVYNAASGVIEEDLASEDTSTTMMVSWGFTVETSFVADVPTNTAIMNAARIELFTILDGYSAIRIECYFPEMTVTYGETSYTATLFVPTIEAIFNSEIIMGTLQDNDIEAIFSQGEITAVHETPEIEAIAAGAVVATLSLSTYIATKGE